ncbi:pyridoxal phosphate-dependent aminotransferase [Aliiruegeria lutimaris]|uniref:aspartate transaminase n=1 Tax=Aliiruegeria lutimaris TaxID=571298 RepID=A0A1G9M650_9RHOB|nr:pyridoxal phosphate-dependent aminotransferase [Aliiruegeria lutimaris]SDL69614.1 aminotransferase [Aliiruegeria lutimaris]
MERTSHLPTGLVSASCAATKISAIKEMSILSARVSGAASLAWGLPSFPTPAPVREAVGKALSEDPKIGMYTLPAGLPEFREAVARDHLRRTGVPADPERHIAATAGNMEGINTLFQVLLDPGDEVVLTDPGFVSHIQQIRFHGGVPVFWPMNEARGWELDTASLDGLLGPRTKAILLVNPSNPTGRVLSEQTLRKVVAIARERAVLIILDDPYSAFVHDDPESFFSLASVGEVADLLAYFFTFSKVHAMSGWRVGYAVVPENLRDEMVKIHDMNMICTPRISQVAAIAALDGDKAHLAEFRTRLKARRDLICERLDRLTHVFSFARPQGAYYVFPRILVPTHSDIVFAHDLLRQARVTVTPGSAFGPSGAGHVRMAYCVGEDVINLAFDRMERHFGVEEA